MTHDRFKFAQKVLHDTRGAEIAEAAAVLPVMFMILLGIFWFGQAFSMYGAITRAAQEGARAGSVPQCSSCAPQPLVYMPYATAATNAVNAALVGSHLDPTLVQNASHPAFDNCPQIFTSCAAGAPCVQVPVHLVKLAQGGGDCGISVSFQYPFTFWLPFTSVNNQKILLTASATMRLETN